MIPLTKRGVIWNIVGQGWRGGACLFLCHWVQRPLLKSTHIVYDFAYLHLNLWRFIWAKMQDLIFLIIITSSLLLFSSNFWYCSLSLWHEATFFSIQISFSVMTGTTVDHYEGLLNDFFCQMFFSQTLGSNLHVPSWVFFATWGGHSDCNHVKVLAFSGQSQEGVATKRSFYKSRKSFDIELSSFEKRDSEGGLT